MDNKLDGKFLKKQKTILLKEKGRLERELKKTKKFPQYGNSEEENSTEVTEFTTQQGLEKDLQKMLNDVLDTLSKVEKGKYGICKTCKKVIHKNRLKAFPAAIFCVKHSQ